MPPPPACGANPLGSVHNAVKAGAQGASIGKYVELAECGLLEAMQRSQRPLYCHVACPEGQFRNLETSQCQNCRAGESSQYLQLQSIINDNEHKTVFTTVKQHRFSSGDYVSFLPAFGVGFLSGRSFEAVVISGFSFFVKDRSGKPLELAYLI